MNLIYLPCLIVCLSVLPLTVLGQPAFLFDCNVDGGCLNAGTCESAGTCSCDPANEGTNCAAVVAGAACATTTCENGATCKAEVCYCATGYTGTDCSTARVTATCDTDEMTINVYPYNSFTSGKIYIEGQDGAECVLDQVSLSDPDQYQKTILLANCGTTNDGNWPLTGTATGTHKTFKLVIQHSNTVITSLDTTVSVNCITFNDGATVTLDAQVASVDTTVGSKATNVNKHETGITMSIKDDTTNNDITGAQNLGTAVKLVSDLDDTKGFTDIQLMTLDAYPTSALVSTDAFSIVAAGCAQTTAETVLTGLAQDTTSRTITTSFKVFGFSGSNEVFLSASYKLCTTTCAAITTCGDASTDITGNSALESVGKRRKRQADDSDTVDMMLVAFHVSPTSSNPNNVIGNPGIQEQSCLANVAFLLPLVVLVVICLMSMAAAMFFCLKLNQRKSNDPERYHGVTGPYKE